MAAAYGRTVLVLLNGIIALGILGKYFAERLSPEAPASHEPAIRLLFLGLTILHLKIAIQVRRALIARDAFRPELLKIILAVWIFFDVIYLFITAYSLLAGNSTFEWFYLAISINSIVQAILALWYFYRNFDTLRQSDWLSGYGILFHFLSFFLVPTLLLASGQGFFNFGLLIVY